MISDIPGFLPWSWHIGPTDVWWTSLSFSWQY